VTCLEKSRPDAFYTGALFSSGVNDCPVAAPLL
jgi:hypothetical protein